MKLIKILCCTMILVIVGDSYCPSKKDPSFPSSQQQKPTPALQTVTSPKLRIERRQSSLESSDVTPPTVAAGDSTTTTQRHKPRIVRKTGASSGSSSSLTTTTTQQMPAPNSSSIIMSSVDVDVDSESYSSGQITHAIVSSSSSSISTQPQTVTPVPSSTTTSSTSRIQRAQRPVSSEVTPPPDSGIIDVPSSSSVSTTTISLDSDQNRQHNPDEHRLWRWTRTFGFHINGEIPLIFRSDRKFSPDLAHIELGEMESRFSFEVESLRRTLKQTILSGLGDFESRKIEIQTIDLEISTLEEMLKNAPDAKNVRQCSAWPTQNRAQIIAKLEQLFAKHPEQTQPTGKEATYLSRTVALLDFLRTQKDSSTIFIRTLERYVEGVERDLSLISTTVNVATLGITLILQRAPSSPYEVLFSPLDDIVFASCRITRTTPPKIGVFTIIGPPKYDFGSSLARTLGIRGSREAIERDYGPLRDTEANAIDYLLYNSRGYESVLHERIIKLLGKNDISLVKGICINIHTKKDPCSLCTRLIEGFHALLNNERLTTYVPGIRLTFGSHILVSSCEDYRAGKTRELFWAEDVAGYPPTGFDLGAYPHILFKILYGAR